MKKSIIIKVILGIIFIYASIAIGGIPKQVCLQGIVTDSTGNPLSDGNYSFSFNIYNQSAGGSSIYTETTSSLEVKSGLFSYYLGTNSTLDLPFGTDYWLGITVGAGEEFSPRQKIVSVGNAYQSLNSDSSGYVKNAITVTTTLYLPDAANILGGTLSNTRLSTNIPQINSSNIWSGTQQFNGRVGINMTNNSHAWLQVAEDGYSQSTWTNGQIMAMGASDSSKRLVLGYDSNKDLGFIQAANSSGPRNHILQNAGGNVGVFNYLTQPTERLEIGTGNMKLQAGNILLASGYTVDGIDISQNNAPYLGNDTTQVLTSATYFDCVTTVNYRTGGVTVNWSAPFTAPPCVTSQLIVTSYADVVSYDVQWTNLTSTSGTFRVNYTYSGDYQSGEASTNIVKVMIHAIGK